MKKAIVGTALLLSGLGLSRTQGALILDLKASNYNAATGTWTDSSGNNDNATQATAANQPTLVAAATPNGASPVVRFNGSQYLTLTTGLSSTAYTVLVFERPGDSGNNPKTLIGGDTGSLQYRIGGDTVSGVNAGDRQELLRRGQSNLGIGNTVMSTSNFYNINVAVDGTGGTFRLNGAADGTAGALASTAAATTIGAAPSGGNPGEFLVGDIAEIQVYNTVLTTTQIQAVESAYTTAYVPEPASLGLVGIAATGLLTRRRRSA